MKIAIIGATGLVGRKILKILEEQNLIPDKLILAASDKSAGKSLVFNKQQHILITIEQAIKEKPNIALFSAGSSVSLKYAPQFAKNGTTVIDNSSAWRMNPKNKLIVPEINADELSVDDKIIANPNCSTIQLVMALAPIHKKYGIKRLIISTYQSVTGTGIQAVNQLKNEQLGLAVIPIYPHPIHQNCLPHCDDFTDNSYTKEEIKLVNETKKILSDNSIKITATAVRVPVIGGHAESVNIELNSDFDISEIKNIMNNTPGIVLQDNPKENLYPMPVTSSGKDEVFVGRIRRDYSTENGLNMWITADNLRKGAATNAVQIAWFLIEKKMI